MNFGCILFVHGCISIHHPPPEKDEWCYTTREIVQHLSSIPKGNGRKRFAVELYSSHKRVLLTSTPLLRHLRNYIDSQVLPKEGDFGGSRGRS